MKENFELLEHIYKDSEMASYTLTKTLEDLKEKDNKIKRLLEDILKEYESWREKSKNILEENHQEIKETGSFSKMMASMGINKEVKNDNSDSSIADMLIEGISMGSIDTEKKIHAYDKDLDKEQLKLAKDFLKFQEKAIDQLKKYL